VSFTTETRLSRTETRTGTITRTVIAAPTNGRVENVIIQIAQWWQATRAIARQVLEVIRAGVTSVGWLMLATATLGLPAGLIWGWAEWVVAGLSATVIIVIALPFLLGTVNYRIDFEASHTKVTVGQDAAIGLSITNETARIALPARLDVPIGEGSVQIYLPLLGPGRSMSKRIPVPTDRRGVVPIGPITLVRTDPIGVLRREARWQERTEVFVRPRIVTTPSTSIGLVRDLDGTPTRKLVDSDISFHAIREYAAGDAQRHVHWKSTAKTGQLMVKQYEVSMRSRLAVVLSCARDEFADDEEFELGVSVAASVAVQGIRDGRDVDAIVSAEIPEVARSRVRAIANLATVTPSVLLDGTCRIGLRESTMPLEEVCRLGAESSDKISLAVLVCGSTVGLRRLRRAALTLPADTAIIAVICDERAHPTMHQLGNLSVLTVGVLDDLTGLLVRAGAT